jgi:hypothetical protein
MILFYLYYFVNCLFYIFQYNLAPIAYNVTGIRRFVSPNKGLRSKTRADKMWVTVGVGVSEATDLASRTLAALRRRTFTVCYAMIFLPPLTTALRHGRRKALQYIFSPYILFYIPTNLA